MEMNATGVIFGRDGRAWDGYGTETKMKVLFVLTIIQWQEGSKTHISASDQEASFAVAGGRASLAIVITW